MNANQFYFEKPKKSKGLFVLPVHLSGLGIKLGEVIVKHGNGCLDSICYVNCYDGKVASRSIDEWVLDYTAIGEFGSISFDMDDFVTELTEMTESASIDELRNAVERYVKSAHSVAVSNKAFLLFFGRLSRMDDFLLVAGGREKGYANFDYYNTRLTAAVERDHDDASFEFAARYICSLDGRSRKQSRSFLKLVFKTETIIENDDENPSRRYCKPVHNMYVKFGNAISGNEVPNVVPYYTDVLVNVEDKDVPLYTLSNQTIGSFIQQAVRIITKIHSSDKGEMEQCLTKLNRCFK